MSSLPERLGGLEPEWKEYLRLGEQLLGQSNAGAQCDLINAAIDSRLGASSHVWLCAPHYPLPGQPEGDILPSDQAPELVQKTFKSHKTNAREGKKTSSGGGVVQEIALPILTREHLLGIVHIRRKGQRHFSSDELNFLHGLAAYVAINLEVTRQSVIKNWHSDQLALVRSVSLQVASIRDIDAMSTQVTRLIQAAFNYYYVAIFTFQAGQNELRFRACASAKDVLEVPDVNHFHLGEGMIGNVAQTGFELIAPDIHLEPVYRHLDGLPETQSEVVFPLKLDDQILGVLDVQSNLLDAFHENDIKVLRVLAGNLALAIQEILLYQDLHRQNEQMSVVYEISRALASVLDLDALFENIVQLISKRLGFPFVHIFTVHPNRRKIIYRMGSGARSEAMRDQLMAYDLDSTSGMIAWVARSGKIRIANDVDQDPLYRPSDLLPANTRAEMTVPLMLGTEVLGILDIQSDVPGVFKDSDVPMLEALGAGIAVAIRNGNLYRSERWRRQAADSFRDVAGLISANVELDKLLDTILTQLERNLPCEASAIWLIDKSGEELNFEADLSHPRLHLAAVHGLEPETVEEAIATSPDARQWMDRAVDFTRPEIRPSAGTYGPLGVALRCPPDYSSLSIPLVAGDKTLGVMTLVHHTASRYGSEARDMTSTFASYAAVAIQNSQLFADAQSQAWISTVLLQVAEAGQTIASVDDLMASMVRLTPLLVGVQKCAVFLWNEGQQNFTLKDWYGFDLLEGNPHRFDDQSAPALALLRSSQAAVFLENAGSELQLPEADLPDATLVLLPFLAHGALLGAFLVTHQVTGLLGVRIPFDPQTLSILQGIAHQTALALENLNLLEARQEEGYVTAVMLQVSQAVASQNKLDDILDTIIHLLPILVGIDACMIYLWDDALKEFYPVQVYTGSRSEEELLMNHTFQSGEFELLDRVIQNQPLFCPMGRADLPVAEWPNLFCLTSEDFSAVSRASNSNWLMGFPLSIKGETYGVLLAKETQANPAFRERRAEIISGVAQQVALAIQNEHLNDEMVDHERIEREIQLAREIQQTFLPNRIPSPLGWEVDARWQTARSVGGDFYDVFRIGKKKLALAIADVSDKGIAAALYMTVTRTLIRANSGVHASNSPSTDPVATERSPAAVLDLVNNQLAADAQNGMFVTAIYALLDLENGHLTYANAGHNRPLIYRAATGEVEQLEKGGMALAVLEDIQYKDHVLDLAPGDCLLLFTDGVTENFNPDEEAYGDGRLMDVMLAVGGQGVVPLLDSIIRSLIDFRQEAAPSDDITMLAIHRLAPE